MLETCGFDADVLAKARCSVEWAGLLGGLRDADNRGLDPTRVIGTLASRPIDPGKDPAAVLRARLHRWERSEAGRWRGRSHMVAGVVPRAEGITDPDLAQAVREREDAITERARSLAEEALACDVEWASQLGPPPTDPALRDGFVGRVAVVAVYRERWGVRTERILGPTGSVGSAEQMAHRNRARLAGQEAARLAASAPERTRASDRFMAERVEPGLAPGHIV